ncbi:MAG: hypothetical protein JW844_04780 [Candidatus Omnitrophica bacterium]|nr:hypothetical protein [Candidatus Omnitrophota bacterium]
MHSNSLNDLLEILNNICGQLDLNYLNPRLRHFKYFQFTFFGLMLRARGLLEIMLFRLEPIENNFSEFKKIRVELLNLRKNVQIADNFIKEKKMREGRDKVIEVAEEYSKIFEDINKLLDKYIP